MQMVTFLLLVAFSVSRAAVINIPVHRSEEGFYTATIDVVGQNARLLVDSGSGDVWIPVVNTGSSIAALASKATTGRPFHIKYGSGGASGTVQSGTMTFPGGLTATCEYGLATREEGQLQQLSSVDGILGLALAGGIEGLVKCLRREDKIPKQVVTFALTETGGTLTIGESPPGLHSLPIVGQGRAWSVPLEGISVKRGSQTENVLDQTEVALLDTGSSGIRAPSEAIAKLAYKLAAEERDGRYRVPCESRHIVADVVFRFTTADTGGKFEVPINSRHLLGDADAKGWCTMKLLPSSSGIWILGGLFFRRMKAVVFDYKEKTISLQVKPDDAPPVSIAGAVPQAPDPSPSSASSPAPASKAPSPPSPPPREGWDTVGQDLVGEAGEIGIHLTTTTTAPKAGSNPMFEAGVTAHALAPTFSSQMVPSEGAAPTAQPVQAKWNDLQKEAINQTASEPVVTPDENDQQAQDLAENMQGLDGIWKTRNEKHPKPAKKCKPKTASPKKKKGSFSQWSQDVKPFVDASKADELGDDLGKALQSAEKDEEDCEEEVAVPEAVTDWSSASNQKSTEDAKQAAKSTTSPAPTPPISQPQASPVPRASATAPAPGGSSKTPTSPPAQAATAKASGSPKTPAAPSSKQEAKAASTDVVAKLKGLDLPWSQDGMDGLPSSFDSAVSDVSASSGEVEGPPVATDADLAPGSQSSGSPAPAAAPKAQQAQAPAKPPAPAPATTTIAPTPTTTTATPKQAKAAAQSIPPRVIDVVPSMNKPAVVVEKHDNSLGNLMAAVDGYGGNQPANVIDKLQSLDQPWSADQVAESSAADAAPTQASSAPVDSVSDVPRSQSADSNRLHVASDEEAQASSIRSSSVAVETTPAVAAPAAPIHHPSVAVEPTPAMDRLHRQTEAETSSLPSSTARPAPRPAPAEAPQPTLPANIPSSKHPVVQVKAEDAAMAANVADQLRDLDQPWSADKIEENMPSEIAPQPAKTGSDGVVASQPEMDSSLNDAFKAFGSDVVPAPPAPAPLAPAVAASATPLVTPSARPVSVTPAVAASATTPVTPSVAPADALQAANSVTNALKGLEGSTQPSQLSDEADLLKDSIAATPPTAKEVVTSQPLPAHEAVRAPTNLEKAIGAFRHAADAVTSTGPGEVSVASSPAKLAKKSSSPEASDSATDRFERDIRWTDPLAGLPADHLHSHHATPPMESASSEVVTPANAPAPALSDEAAKVTAKLAGSSDEGDDTLSKLGDAFGAFGAPAPAAASSSATEQIAPATAVVAPAIPALTMPEPAMPAAMPAPKEEAPTFAKPATDHVLSEPAAQPPTASFSPNVVGATPEQSEHAKMVTQRLQSLGSHSQSEAPKASPQASADVVAQPAADNDVDLSKLNSAFDAFGEHSEVTSTSTSAQASVTDAKRVLDKAEASNFDLPSAAASSPTTAVRAIKASNSLPSLTKSEKAWIKHDDDKQVERAAQVVSADSGSTTHAIIRTSSSEDTLVNEALARRNLADNAAEIFSKQDGVEQKGDVSSSSQKSVGAADVTATFRKLSKETAPSTAATIADSASPVSSDADNADASTDFNADAVLAGGDLPDWAVNRLWAETQHAVTHAKHLDVNQDPEHVLEARIDEIKNGPSEAEKTAAAEEKVLNQAVARREKATTTTDESYFNEALAKRHVTQPAADDDLSLSTPTSAFKEALSVAAPTDTKFDTSDSAIDKLWEETQEAAAGAHSLHSKLNGFSMTPQAASPADAAVSVSPVVSAAPEKPPEPSATSKLWDGAVQSALPAELPGTSKLWDKTGSLQAVLPAELPATSKIWDKTVGTSVQSALPVDSFESSKLWDKTVGTSVQSKLPVDPFETAPVQPPASELAGKGSSSGGDSELLNAALSRRQAADHFRESMRAALRSSGITAKSGLGDATATTASSLSPNAMDSFDFEQPKNQLGFSFPPTQSAAASSPPATTTTTTPLPWQPTAPLVDPFSGSFSVEDPKEHGTKQVATSGDSFDFEKPKEELEFSIPHSTAASSSFGAAKTPQSVLSAATITTTSLPWQPTAAEESSALNDALQRREVADTKHVAPLVEDITGKQVASSVVSFDFEQPKEQREIFIPSTAATLPSYDYTRTATTTSTTSAPLPWQPTASEENSALDDALHRRQAAETGGFAFGSRAKEQQVLSSAVPGMDDSELSGLGDAFDAFDSHPSAAAAPTKAATPLAEPATVPSPQIEAMEPKQLTESPTGLPWQPSQQEERFDLDAALKRRQAADYGFDPLDLKPKDTPKPVPVSVPSSDLTGASTAAVEDTMKLGPVSISSDGLGVATAATVAEHQGAGTEVARVMAKAASTSSSSFGMDDDFDDDPFKAAHEAAQRMTGAAAAPQPKGFHLRVALKGFHEVNLPAWATSAEKADAQQQDNAIQPAATNSVSSSRLRGGATSAPAPASSSQDRVDYYKNQLLGGSDW